MLEHIHDQNIWNICGKATCPLFSMAWEMGPIKFFPSWRNTKSRYPPYSPATASSAATLSGDIPCKPTAQSAKPIPIS